MAWRCRGKSFAITGSQGCKRLFPANHDRTLRFDNHRQLFQMRPVGIPLKRRNRAVCDGLALAGFPVGSNQSLFRAVREAFNLLVQFARSGCQIGLGEGKI